MYDWNDDGKYDEFDQSMDYYIFDKMEKEGYYSSGGSGGDFLTFVGSGLLILGILLIISILFG